MPKKLLYALGLLYVVIIAFLAYAGEYLEKHHQALRKRP